MELAKSLGRHSFMGRTQSVYLLLYCFVLHRASTWLSRMELAKSLGRHSFMGGHMAEFLLRTFSL